MLSAKGYAYDGDTKKKSKKKMGHGDPEAAKDDPDDIGESLQTAAGWTAVDYFSSKGPQHEVREFKTLQSERNSNDGTA